MLKGCDIVWISSSQYHSGFFFLFLFFSFFLEIRSFSFSKAAVSFSGDVLTWGRGDFGRLGRGDCSGSSFILSFFFLILTEIQF